VNEPVIELLYRAVDGFTASKAFMDLAAARRWAWERVGRHPELGSHYAASADGVGTLLPERGVTLAELFPEERCEHDFGAADPAPERVASPLSEAPPTRLPEVLATRGARAVFRDGSHGIVDQDDVLKNDDTVWLMIGDVRARVLLGDVAEFLPADGPGCSAGGGAKPVTAGVARQELADALRSAVEAWRTKHGVTPSRHVLGYVRGHLGSAVDECMMDWSSRPVTRGV
jgi:hypothetical protein